jgi:hypothetical protein
MPVIVVLMGQIIALASAENKEVLGWRRGLSDSGKV